MEALVAHRPDVIVHLAGVVSGEAEADFEKGYRVNLDGTRALLEAVRAAGLHPRFVFASTEAVFGAPFPDVIPDDLAPQPLTSYGTQKLISELLVNDYSRRGFLDGVSLRFPTICVRPGAPNRAASGFFSGIVREPLAGFRPCCRCRGRWCTRWPRPARRWGSCSMRRRWTRGRWAVGGR